MKRVLIITYYWPPSGGSGVQRWLKMSKYLPENGWQPVIYTAEGAEYPVEDPSLEKDVCPEAEVIRRPIVEPYNFYKKFLGIKKEQKVKAGFIDETGKQKGWKERLSVWIRGNFFIPDARCWWVKPSVRYLKSYLKEHPVDAIISTGPPHSMHLIAMKLKAALGLPWIADFRDPWTEIDFYGDLHLTRWANRKHHRLEHRVLTKADKVVAIGWDMAEGLKRLGADNPTVIPNGYDWDAQTQPTTMPLSKDFTLTHIGIIGANRNEHQLWQALHELASESETFRKALKIKLIGQVDQSVVRSIADSNLQEIVEIIPYMPHDQVLQLQQSSQMLLLFINNTPNAKGILTGKLFEYLASGRPILCIGPENGDAARIINETHTGQTVDFDDREKMKETIKKYYQQYVETGLPSNKSQEIEKYSRKALAGDFASLLNHYERK
ncbi:MAG: glycosyltransferase family 4 protein [Bacteroidales bacterium]|nr:glycosyltransferase family 4 protein [Bacteroidales bacterium]